MIDSMSTRPNKANTRSKRKKKSTTLRPKPRLQACFCTIFSITTLKKPCLRNLKDHRNSNLYINRPFNNDIYLTILLISYLQHILFYNVSLNSSSHSLTTSQTPLSQILFRLFPSWLRSLPHRTLRSRSEARSLPQGHRYRLDKCSEVLTKRQH